MLAFTKDTASDETGFSVSSGIVKIIQVSDVQKTTSGELFHALTSETNICADKNGRIEQLQQ